MARGSIRAKRRQRNQFFAIAAVAIFLATVGSAIGYYLFHKEPKPDKDTLCPAAGPTGHVVLLVDRTDPMTFIQKNAFETEFRDIVEHRTPKGALLSVFVLGEDFTETAKPILEICNPGSGEDKSEFNANLKRLRTQYETKFVKPVLKQTDSLISIKGSNKSPIFEMIQLVGINGFRSHAIDGERRLIIVSDMLHNTPEFSMYKQLPDFETFAQTPYGRKVQADLQGVEVELEYLMNDPQRQTRRNAKFWEDYFNKAHARLVSARPMEG
ncbi:hypothetical protein [Cupriavidus sp. UYPR2.512]|uniref:hypothetical protein n=1 Tax=Cupriavidus sp. UYPR2.512 TaxID=1080187 RepID=UPI0003829D39|nr:hypothetical protein [Cupriavidus sp. UYPR2.512]UIF88585.1 hypothetical protein KAF44_25065 [Cupriavidus necator]